VSLLPLGAELILENTYPVDPAAGMSLLQFSLQLSGGLLLLLAGYLDKDISKDLKKIEVKNDLL